MCNPLLWCPPPGSSQPPQDDSEADTVAGRTTATQEEFTVVTGPTPHSPNFLPERHATVVDTVGPSVAYIYTTPAIIVMEKTSTEVSVAASTVAAKLPAVETAAPATAAPAAAATATTAPATTAPAAVTEEARAEVTAALQTDRPKDEVVVEGTDDASGEKRLSEMNELNRCVL